MDGFTEEETADGIDGGIDDEDHRIRAVEEVSVQCAHLASPAHVPCIQSVPVVVELFEVEHRGGIHEVDLLRWFLELDQQSGLA